MNNAFQGSDVFMKETPRRGTTVASFLIKISKDQLENRVWGGRRYHSTSSRYLKTT
jgi:hypothetical protein